VVLAKAVAVAEAALVTEAKVAAVVAEVAAVAAKAAAVVAEVAALAAKAAAVVAEAAAVTVKRVDGKVRQPDRMTQYSSIRVTEQFFYILNKKIQHVSTTRSKNSAAQCFLSEILDGFSTLSTICSYTFGTQQIFRLFSAQ
jgi:hypothetical protein